MRQEMTDLAGRWHTTPDALRRFFSNTTRAHAAKSGIPLEELQLPASELVRQACPVGFPAVGRNWGVVLRAGVDANDRAA
jgi:hypothetical protein